MADLRRNLAKHKLAGGGVVSVVMGPMTPDIIEHLGQLDLDGMWLEGEHGPVDFGDISDLTRACDLWGKSSIARVNLNLPGVIYRTLDNGAMGVAVPHIRTAAEARAVVEAAKFAPIGSRGSYTSRQGYGVPDYFRRANDETMIILLIESVTGLTNLSEILEVEHVDVFYIARGDLAQSMGYVGQPDHPEVVAATERGTKQIVAAGRAAGAVVNDSNVVRWIESGARFVSFSWLPWVATGARGYLERVASASRRS